MFSKYSRCSPEAPEKITVGILADKSPALSRLVSAWGKEKGIEYPKRISSVKKKKKGVKEK